MGRNRNYYLAMDEDFDITVEKNPDLTIEEFNKLRIKGDLDSIAYSIANLADALEELNENIKNLAADRNTNPAHADDGK